MIYIIFILFTTLTALVFTEDAYALDPAMYPIEIELWDGMVFYMTPPEFEEEGHPKSGLYRDGVLIYTVDIWEFWGTLYFSNDGMSFLIIPQGMGSIPFYEQGVLTHYHDVRDLLRDAQKLEREWEPEPFEFTGPPWIVDVSHERDSNRLFITTVEGDQLLIDLSTGLILSQDRVVEHDSPGYDSSEDSSPESDSPRYTNQFIFVIVITVVILVATVGVITFRKIISRKR